MKNEAKEIKEIKASEDDINSEMSDVKKVNHRHFDEN